MYFTRPKSIRTFLKATFLALYFVGLFVFLLLVFHTYRRFNLKIVSLASDSDVRECFPINHEHRVPWSNRHHQLEGEIDFWSL